MEIIKPSVDTKIKTSDKRVSDVVLKHLNDQIKVEADAAQIYYTMAEWCDNQGYFGLGSKLKKHSDEERGHMDKVYEYISDRDALPITPKIDAPKKQTFLNIKEVVKASYEHEKFVTGTYNSLADLCISEKDYMTFNFALQFLKEQKEEEAKFKSLLDELNAMDNDKRSMYLFDQRLKEDSI